MSDALYLAGPIPIARYDLGTASLTVNGALNFVNGVANAGLNTFGVLTEPLDRYQGEITSVETGLGPFGMAAAAPTLLLGRLSSAIRAESALNARFLSNERIASKLDMRVLDDALPDDSFSVFYHGTSAEIASDIRIKGIDLTKGSEFSDFGQGFYMTTSRDDALASAARLYSDDALDVVSFNVPMPQWEC